MLAPMTTSRAPTISVGRISSSDTSKLKEANWSTTSLAFSS